MWGKDEKSFGRFPTFTQQQALDFSAVLYAVCQWEEDKTEKVKITLVDSGHRVKAKGIQAVAPIAEFMSQGGFRVVRQMVMNPIEE